MAYIHIFMHMDGLLLLYIYIYKTGIIYQLYWPCYWSLLGLISYWSLHGPGPAPPHVRGPTGQGGTTLGPGAGASRWRLAAVQMLLGQINKPSDWSVLFSQATMWCGMLVVGNRWYRPRCVPQGWQWCSRHYVLDVLRRCRLGYITHTHPHTSKFQYGDMEGCYPVR